MSKTYTIQTGVTLEQYEVLKEKAEYLGLVLSNYLRLVSLHGSIPMEEGSEGYYLLAEKANVLGISVRNYVEIVSYKLDNSVTTDTEKVVQIKLSESQHKIVTEKADSLGISVRSYLRLIALSGDVSVSISLPNTL